jgi:NhaP-type Na+/H+ or K+/H+ antiporter
LAKLLTSIVIGAAWGAVIGFVAHWATSRRRDITSLRGPSADRFDVVVDPETAAEAARLLRAREAA